MTTTTMNTMPVEPISAGRWKELAVGIAYLMGVGIAFTTLVGVAAILFVK
ncbi:hypothetical protein [Magnetospirillum sp. LM-5]|nr:hypothetical protein [Magnetospirillum sp. LM-5]